MPKLKTNRGAAKRFRRTSGGKFARNKSHRRHILTSKSSKRKRHLREATVIADADQHAVARLLPYA